MSASNLSALASVWKQMVLLSHHYVFNIKQNRILTQNRHLESMRYGYSLQCLGFNIHNEVSSDNVEASIKVLTSKFILESILITHNIFILVQLNNTENNM